MSSVYIPPTCAQCGGRLDVIDEDWITGQICDLCEMEMNREYEEWARTHAIHERRPAEAPESDPPNWPQPFPGGEGPKAA